jgi:hypothetical protein
VLRQFCAGDALRFKVYLGGLSDGLRFKVYLGGLSDALRFKVYLGGLSDALRFKVYLGGLSDAHCRSLLLLSAVACHLQFLVAACCGRPAGAPAPLPHLRAGKLLPLCLSLCAVFVLFLSVS